MGHLIAVTVRHYRTCKPRTMMLPVTAQQLDAWEQGTLVQVAMPQLDAYQREFLISGMLPSEQDAFFNQSEDK